jgi:hypothetical protein
LESGDFVLDLGGIPIILNNYSSIDNIQVYYTGLVGGLYDIQVSVNNHVVYEADIIGNDVRA